jgi:hypothetical protein
VAAVGSVHPAALPASPEPPAALARLHAFRAGLHACCPRRADALVDLAERCFPPRAGHLAAPAEPGAGPPARLGQHLRRAGPRPHRRRAAPRPAGRLPATRRPTGVRGGRDRLAALRRRGLAGAWSVLPSLPPRGRPTDHCRLGVPVESPGQLGAGRLDRPGGRGQAAPLADTDQQAAGQLRALVGRRPAGGPVPLVVLDGGDDSAQLTLDLAEVPVAVLVRLRSDRCFAADPPHGPWQHRPATPARGQVRLRRPHHLAGPTATLRCQDDQDGTVTVAAWAGLQPKQPRHPGHGSGRPRPLVPGTIPGVPAQRVPPGPAPQGAVAVVGQPRPARPGSGVAGVPPPVRPGAHGQVRQADPGLDDPTAPPARPLDLAGAGRLPPAAPGPPAHRRSAAAVGAARPQPHLSPVRVRRGFPRLLCTLGSPATTPKPAGRSPGRPKGRCSGPATRYPAINKPANKPHSKPTTATKAA